jgi:hypothetical protein
VLRVVFVGAMIVFGGSMVSDCGGGFSKKL